MYTDVILKKHALELIYFDSNKLKVDETVSSDISKLPPLS